ncbi:MAG: hypothetical protein IKE51_01865 [Solobacterium sp.]|nr:hypothetical protein [Solobacterium sp.]
MKMRKRFKITTALLLITLLFGCAKDASKDVIGSWVLDEVKGVKGSEKVTLDRENHASIYGGDYYYTFKTNGKAELIQTDGTGASDTTEGTWIYADGKIHYTDSFGDQIFVYDKKKDTLTVSMTANTNPEYSSIEFVYKRK